MRFRRQSPFLLLCLSLLLAPACSTDDPDAPASTATDTAATAPDDPGLVHVESAYDVPTTVQRLTDALKQKGITVFNTIDHAEGAAGVDMELRPTTLVIFGNPAVGTPLMQCNQTMGIALPMKMLAWADADGTVRLAYVDPATLADRHDLGPECEGPVRKARTALENFAAVATSE
jgi:uncharacterized protein (DUF302 family)